MTYKDFTQFEIAKEKKKETILVLEKEILISMHLDELRPISKVTRFSIDNEYVSHGYLARLSKNVSVVYMALLLHCNRKRQSCFPSIEMIVKKTGIKNKTQVTTAIKTLEAFKIIKVGRSGGGSMKPNVYMFINSKYWVPVDNIPGSPNKRYQFNKENSVKISMVNSNPGENITVLKNNYKKNITDRRSQNFKISNNFTSIGDVLKNDRNLNTQFNS